MGKFELIFGIPLLQFHFPFLTIYLLPITNLISMQMTILCCHKFKEILDRVEQNRKEWRHKVNLMAIFIDAKWENACFTAKFSSDQRYYFVWCCYDVHSKLFHNNKNVCGCTGYSSICSPDLFPPQKVDCMNHNNGPQQWISLPLVSCLVLLIRGISGKWGQGREREDWIWSSYFPLSLLSSSYLLIYLLFPFTTRHSLCQAIHSIKLSYLSRCNGFLLLSAGVLHYSL